MKRVLVIASLVIMGAWPASGIARAQAPAIQVITGTVPISAELRTTLESFLNAYPPAAAVYYAPTYVKDQGVSTLVSLAALDLASPDEPWHLESHDGDPRQVVWIGTVRIFDDGSGELYSRAQTRAKVPGFAVPMVLAPGGGTYVRWPFQPGASMQYGPRLIHGSGDYGTSGMYAIDLVGGSSLGTNVASPTVFASGTGTVDYVCVDDTSAAVRTHNDTTDDTFVYAHMLDNASLELDHVFNSGGTIGTLKSGSFDDTCGWADQGDTIYHVHWMFEPAGGAYSVGGCTITQSDKKIHCGDKTIGSGGWVTNTMTGTGVDDPSGAGSSYVPSIWDNIVGAIVIFVTGTADLLPEHNSASVVLMGALNTVVLFFRLAWVLLRGNLNLMPIAIILLFLIAVRIPYALIWLTFWLIRVVRILKQTILF